MKVCVVLPTKNEVHSIQEMITRIKKLDYDLIVVDENSDDGTIEIARKNRVPVYQREGAGKGYGTLKALEIVNDKRYDVMVIIDCDCTYPPEYIPKIIGFMDRYDMVVGIRGMENIPYLHRLPNIFHTQLINFLYFSSLKDINSGLRAIRVRKFMNKLDAKGFDTEAQMTIIALKNKMRIKEIPVKYKKRKGDSKIRIKDGFVIAWRIIRDRFRK